MQAHDLRKRLGVDSARDVYLEPRIRPAGRLRASHTKMNGHSPPLNKVITMWKVSDLPRHQGSPALELLIAVEDPVAVGDAVAVGEAVTAGDAVTLMFGENTICAGVVVC